MFKLKDLGKYKIDRTEDYEWAKSTGEDLIYYEMIRVKGSKPSRYFTVPSHLYKYGEHTLACTNFLIPFSIFSFIAFNSFCRFCG